jgi:FkbM family methyltransferase
MSLAPADLRGPYDTVLDVGAFRGDFAVACLEAWPECVVHSFEPLEPEPARCKAEGRWTWWAAAIGAQSERVTINRNEFIPSSSVLPMAELHREAFPYTRKTEPVEVGMARLDEFVDLVQSAALLKIDVQGYELEVLRGAGDVLTLCGAVVLEVSHEVLYEGAPSYEQIDTLLAASGFVHRGRVDEMAHPKAPRRVLQSDELWTRASWL